MLLTAFAEALAALPHKLLTACTHAKAVLIATDAKAVLIAIDAKAVLIATDAKAVLIATDAKAVLIATAPKPCFAACGQSITACDAAVLMAGAHTCQCICSSPAGSVPCMQCGTHGRTAARRLFAAVAAKHGETCGGHQRCPSGQFAWSQH